MIKTQEILEQGKEQNTDNSIPKLAITNFPLHDMYSRSFFTYKEADPADYLSISTHDLSLLYRYE